MSDQREKFSISRHFRREGVIQAAVIAVPVIVALLVALIAPWLYQHFL